MLKDMLLVMMLNFTGVGVGVGVGGDKCDCNDLDQSNGCTFLQQSSTSRSVLRHMSQAAMELKSNLGKIQMLFLEASRRSILVRSR